ncbi:Sas10 C-terminal domain-containing protein [Coniochaeta sp. 2T2.1]|nr:Sas10 C-terminal domain-containing protein [Coniochaeta sp. 2T2.1]
MGKRRRAVAKPEGPSGPREVDPSEAKLKITSYKDVADSEEEYFIEKDRIDFDDEPRSKKLRRQQKEEEFLEPSDEEVFEESDDDSDASDNEARAPAPKSKSKKGKPVAELSDDEVDQQGEEEEDSGWWGTSRKDYYNADQIETEADALEEEAEARRLQQKKLAKMSEADFMFDENEWLAPSKDEGMDEAEVVTEVLKDVPVTDDMTAEDRYKLLQARYPEFDYLVDEFQTLQPLLVECQKEAEGKLSKSVEMVKYWALGAYVASLASYFAILTSPARDENGAQKTMDPAELREHDIMDTLMTCRAMWQRVQKLKAPKSAPIRDGLLSPPEEDIDMLEAAAPKRKTAADKQAAKAAKANKKKAAEKAKKTAAVEEELADLDDLLKKPKSAKIKTGESAATKYTEDHRRDAFSDFGEEETLDARTAADKDKRKKSLKFYTSQIVQKASKRANAGADAGGDADIPYRERLRDRQARLNAEAEKRGKRDNKKGTELGGSDDEEGEDREVAAKLRGDADEYYDLVAQKTKQRREEKISRFEAIAAAKRGEKIVEQEVVGDDGKRKITYAIDKNKGLAPRRKKEVRNPRVKKRMQYADKQKKLRSMKPTYKGGEGKGGYQGELSGIKTGLVKSVRL